MKSILNRKKALNYTKIDNDDDDDDVSPVYQVKRIEWEMIMSKS